ncbi:MAG: Tad domain-containing protein, partial [Paracoccaceae bacterium]
MFSVFWDLNVAGLGGCIRFLKDEAASMATQVVIFSVLLFGTSGVVLDFGRVYSEHSQMQIFTDHAALSAAAELDRGPGAIDRAIAAVFSEDGRALIPKAASFSEGDGDEFRISHLFFLSDLTSDSGAQYDLTADIGGPNLLYTAFANGGGAGGDVAIAATQAKYVVAVAEERSVRNTLMRLINAAGSDSVRETNVVRTIAAAKHSRIACGALSNLVICNPWEGDAGASFESVMDEPGAAGVQFRHRARRQNVDTGEIQTGDGLARRLSLEGPAAVRQICSDPLTLPGANPSMSADEAATAFAICMMASALEDKFCVSDTIAVVPASPEEITTALGTAFDLWDEPISAVLDWDRDGDGDQSQAVDELGASLFDTASAHPLRDLSPFFQPDLDVLKGRVWDEPTAIDNKMRGVPASSRLNYPERTDSERIDLVLNPCIRPATSGGGVASSCFISTEGDIIPYVTEPSTNSSVTQYFIDAFPLRFDRDFATPAGDITSFYEAYLTERRDWLHSSASYTTSSGVSVVAGQSTAWTGEDGSLDTNLAAPNQFTSQIQTRLSYDASGAREDSNGDGVIDNLDFEPAYSNYTYNPPHSPIDRELERRV